MNLTPEIEVVYHRLAAAFSAERLAHAYMIIGPVEETVLLATRLLAFVYCVSAEVGQAPCGNCTACRLALEHKHPSMLWLEPQKRSRHISTDQADTAQKHLLQTSLDGSWKSVVFCEADRLNNTAANRLLKTFEEPPPKCLFLLLTAFPEAVPVTIRSRCQQVLTRSGAAGAADTDWQELVDEVFALPGKGMVSAMARARRVSEALGTVRKTIEKEEMNNFRRRERDEHLEGAAREEAESLAEAQVVARLRAAANALLVAFQRLCIEALRIAAGVPVEESCSATVLRIAQGLTATAILHNLRLLEEANRRMMANMNHDWVFQRMFAEWSVPGGIA